jgi:glycosyltransferase involved in cell wall biosynthesis
MSTPALMTVLMPVYNAERFLREAIDSILNQTFSQFEFLIIDDGSTDNTIKIIQEYRDERIRLVRNEENMGISYTLNKGIALASSDLIARMDADDISSAQRLQKQFDYMVANKDCALLSCWARVITEDKKLVRLERYRSEFYYYNLTFECWMYHPTVMFRKDAVKAVGMYSMPYSEDYDLFWKLSVKFRIWNLPEALVDYRLSSTSLNTVLRKVEYDIANEQNVIRNIRYYTGDDFEIKKEHLECLRHNFEPLLRINQLNSILECLSKLEFITEKIKKVVNPNSNAETIGRAFYYKRRFIITQLVNRLPLKTGLQLLIRTGTADILWEKVSRGLKWRINKLKSIIYR